MSIVIILSSEVWAVANPSVSSRYTFLNVGDFLYRVPEYIAVNMSQKDTISIEEFEKTT